MIFIDMLLWNQSTSEITSLKPSDILIHNEIVVIQIYGGGSATHRGFCIFLSDKPTKINRIVKELELIEIEKKYNIFEYSLYDLRMIENKWDAEQKNSGDAKQLRP